MQVRVTVSLINCPFAKGAIPLPFLSHSHIFLPFTSCQPWHRSNPKVSWHRTYTVGAKVNTFLPIINLSGCGSRWAAAPVQEQGGQEKTTILPGIRGPAEWQPETAACDTNTLRCQTAMSGAAPLISAEGAQHSSAPRSTRRSWRSRARELPGTGSWEVKTNGTDPMDPKSLRVNFLV